MARAWMRTLATGLALVTIGSGTAAAADAPRWVSTYDWPAGDGASGWASATSGTPGPYGFSADRPGRPGLWVWPSGGAYPPARALWRLPAPGTTRIASATVTATFPNRLLSHHCVEVALGDRAPVVDCKPRPDANGTTTASYALKDPAAAAAALTIGLVEPCDKVHAAACTKHVPAAAPERNGLRVLRAALVLTDDDAPAAQAAGPLHDLAGEYIDGRGSIDVTLAGQDAGSGIAALALERGGSDLFTRTAPCDPRHRTPELGARVCPAEYTVTAPLDTTVLPEGRSEFAARATDVAGTAGRSEPWAVIVDRSAPAPAAEFEASLDAEEGVTYLDWVSGADPVLADGTPGSGVGLERYRYRPDGGDWSDWLDVQDGQAEVADLRLGQRIDVEAYAVDRVGNRSETSADTIVVEPVSASNEDYDAVFEDPDTIATAYFTTQLGVPGDLATLDGGSNPRRKCAMSGIDPRLTERGGEANVNVYTFGNFGCPVGDIRLQYIQVTACLQVKGNDGDWHRVGDKCAVDKQHAPQPPVYAIVNELCRPGTHDYRVKLHGKAALRAARDVHVRHTLSEDDINCNEAGAWRVEATENTSSPSATLGRALTDANDDPPARSGFAAHHIVPASYGSRAALAQRYAYDCGFNPNSERNGVWLRGRDLRAKGEAGATHDEPAYTRLSEDGKARAYHPTLHTKRQFDWVADQLADAIYGNDQCRQPEGNVYLRSAKVLLEHNAAPFRPEDDDPVSSDD